MTEHVHAWDASLAAQVDLYEERALILSKLGQHENALSIYAHRLGDVEMAQACDR